jgi:hypothetical protein
MPGLYLSFPRLTKQRTNLLKLRISKHFRVFCLPVLEAFRRAPDVFGHAIPETAMLSFTFDFLDSGSEWME